MNIQELKTVVKSIMGPVIEIGLLQDKRLIALERKDWETAREIKNQLINYKKPSLSTIGEAGVGKTEAIEQVATEMGIPIISFRVGEFVDNGDIQGMPRIVEKNGELVTVTMLPEFYPKKVLDENGNYVLREDGGIMYDYESVKEYIDNYEDILEFYDGDINQAPGLLVFYDELNRVSAQDVKNALFKIFEKYSIGRYQFPNGTFIVTATNPNTDDYVVDAILEEKAFKTRFMHVFVEGDNDVLLSYMRERKYEKVMQRFVNQKSEEINKPGEPYDLDIEINGRMISFANSMIQYVKLHETLPTHLFQELMSGVLGVNAVALTEMITNGFKDKIEPEDIIFRYDEIEHEFIALMESEVIDTGRLNQLKNDMIDYLLEIESSEERFQLFSENVDNIVKFTENFLDEYLFAFLTELSKRESEEDPNTIPWHRIFARNDAIAERIIELNKKVSEGEIKNLLVEEAS